MNTESTANNVATLPATPKPQTSREVIQANVDLLIQQLEAGHSEGLTAYLTAMGRFHNYSFGNILEIARQRPDATRVAGLYAWNQLGRKVVKGQKGTRLRWEQRSIFHVARLEPFPQYLSIQRDVVEHPCVTDVVEAATDVTFQHPGRAVFLTQHTETLLDGVGGRAFRPKTAGIGIGGRLRDRKQRQQIQRLHGTVLHRGDSQRSQLSIGLRDVNPPQRLRTIPAPPQRVDGLVPRRRGAPDRSVDARRIPALVVRHALHSQRAAMERVGQQPLQGFYPAVTAFLCCLDDTRLQSPDHEFTAGPVDLLPLRLRAGGCTHGLLHIHLQIPP